MCTRADVELQNTERKEESAFLERIHLSSEFVQFSKQRTKGKALALLCINNPHVGFDSSTLWIPQSTIHICASYKYVLQLCRCRTSKQRRKGQVLALWCSPWLRKRVLLNRTSALSDKLESEKKDKERKSLRAL